MNRDQVSIATITWARDEQEETLLRNSLQHLATLGIPVFITDGGSGDGFLDFLRGFPYFTLFNATQKGVWMQAKNSLAQAYQSGSPFIFYTEPDKLDFFAHALPQMLENILVNEQSGIMLAARSADGFATFPAFQQMTETTINNCCAEVTGKFLDYTYGPFLMNRQLVPYLNVLEPNIGWGWRPYAFGIASRLGYNAEAFTGNFYCPPEQQQDSPAERIYRMRQLSQNIEGITLSATADLQKK